MAGILEDAAREAQCRRIAAWSVALEHAMQPAGDRIPEILELAEALDAHFAWEPFREPGDEPDEVAQAALALLRVATADDLDCAIRNLPVFPVAARRVLEAILTDHWSAAQLESIA
jgi:hypothetical protein